jgi:hypothetical protein
VELTKAVPALRRVAQASAHTDAFSLLTAATGGIQLHFRKQNQLENAIIALGDALHSRYLLSYVPIDMIPASTESRSVWTYQAPPFMRARAIESLPNSSP